LKKFALPVPEPTDAYSILSPTEFATVSPKNEALHDSIIEVVSVAPPDTTVAALAALVKKPKVKSENVITMENIWRNGFMC
jgi:hypothetical protein